MGQTKIRAFKGLRNGREDPNEYLLDIEWAYEEDLKGKEPAIAADGLDELAMISSNKTHRMVFRHYPSSLYHGLMTSNTCLYPKIIRKP